jgi:acetolactate synthase-1/2/3 large subunit
MPLDEETRNASSPSHNGAIEEILNHLAEAKRPIILAGPAMGRSPRWSEVEALSNILNIPALPMESPRGVNDPWLHFATNNLAEADLVLLLGKKVDFTLKFGQSPFFAPKCRFVQIDADQSQLIEEKQVILRSWNDPLGVVRQLTAAAQSRNWASTSWPNEVQTAQKTLPAEWDPLFESSAVPIHPLRVCGALQPFLKEDATLISDGGEFGQWAQAGLEAHTRLINGPSGSIGSSLPMGLGAKLAHPEHRVFVALGDGTFGFHALEFDTALRYNLPIIAVIGNDARWNAEHQLQLQNYGEERTVGCDLLPSRYDKLVTSLGGHGEFVQHPDELGSAFERAMASELPACVNILIESVGAPTFRLNKA